jgi:hypothetical protein
MRLPCHDGRQFVLGFWRSQSTIGFRYITAGDPFVPFGQNVSGDPLRVSGQKVRLL